MADISIDTGINMFKNNIAQVISTSQLPVSVLYYVLKDVVSEIGEVYQQTLLKESEEIKKQLEENKEDVQEEHQEN